MNREIKFRLWESKFKEMIYLPNDTRDLVFTDEGPKPLCFHRGMPLPLSDLNYIIMQYTGLTDKNGKEVYEGDIIKIILKTEPTYPSQSPPETTYLHEIVYDERQARFREKFISKSGHLDTFYGKNKGLSISSYETEVIGNIYENKELISD